MAKRTIICASPYAAGKSERAARDLAALLGEACPDDQIRTLFLSKLTINYCRGCNACAEREACVIDDDMATVFDELEQSDVLYIVSPIYFAGPPANYKAMLDRFQPYYWTYQAQQPKRPAVLIALGEGGDPHGYEPLVVCTRSALSVVGFSLQQTFAYLGTSSEGITEALTASADELICAALSATD